MSGEPIRRRKWLPHWETANAIYFVTFRLHDSLAKGRLEYLRFQRRNIPATAEQVGRSLTPKEKEQLKRLLRKRVEEYLDRGAGACYLKEAKVAQIVAHAIRHFSGQRYRLFAWVVMPNHVHVVFQPYPGETLAQIVHSWKSYTANKANRVLNRRGPFWQREYYDHWIRNKRQMSRILRYVAENPERAGLKNWPWMEVLEVE